MSAADLAESVRKWVRKAEGDLVSAEFLLASAGVPLPADALKAR